MHGRRRVDPPAGREAPDVLSVGRVQAANAVGVLLRHPEPIADDHRLRSLAGQLDLPLLAQFGGHGRRRRAASLPVAPIHGPVVGRDGSAPSETLP